MARQLGDALRELRRRARLTQRELADIAGLSVAVLRDIEQGRVTRPRASTIRPLADALDLSASEREELQRAVADGGSDGQLRLGVLGPLLVEVGGMGLVAGSQRRRALLGLLALSIDAPVSRDALVDAVWRGEPPANAVEVLLTEVSRTRRWLLRAGAADGVLDTASGGYQLRVDELDLRVFRETAGRARRQRDAGELARACESFGSAVALWRGDVLEDAPALRDHPVVTGLRQEWHSAVLEYTEVAVESAQYTDVLPLVRDLAAADPLHERAHALLMITLAGAGQRADALRVFDDVRARLADELGADPGAELIAAHRRVLHDEVDRAESVPVSAHRQLPPDVADFSGRDAEIALLRDRVPVAVGGPTAVVISTLEGMGGVGKTSLAVHVAHQLLTSGRYTDAQLYVDLRGHADQPPADPSTVLASFLRLVGVPGDQIPHDVAARAALYRDRLYDKDALVLLDNAASDDQVTPLIPAGPRNLVLVTSRRSLALDGAYALQLDVFSVPEAEALFTRLLGSDRVAAEPIAVRQVIDLCGRLPIAVALAARRLRARPRWRFADLVELLGGADGRVDELGAGSGMLRAVFDLSYQALAADARRAFRVLGLYQGVDFTADTVAALAGTSVDDARGVLDHLVDEHLVTVTGGERYGLHDLLRDYARRIVHEETTAEQRGAARDRLLGYYAYACDAGRKKLLAFERDDVTLTGDPPASLPEFADDSAALRWFAVENSNIAAAIADANQQGHMRAAWQLAVMLRNYYERVGNKDSWLATGETGLAAARHVGDRKGEALLLNHLGVVHGQLGDPERARQLITEAIDISGAIGDVKGRGRYLNNLGIAAAMLGRYDEALRVLTEALEIVRTSGTPPLEANVLGNLGSACAQLGRYEDAIRYLRPALRIRRDVGDVVGVALTMHSIGDAELTAGRGSEAIKWLEQAREMHAKSHCRAFETNVLDSLGIAYRSIGKEDAARACWQQAWQIRTEIGHPGADEMLDKTVSCLLDLAGDETDLPAFRQLVERARGAHDAGDSETACDLFEKAFDLWRGAALEGIAGQSRHPVIESLERDFRAAVLDYAAAAADVERHEAVVPLLRQVVSTEPLNEAAHAALVIALAGCGERDEALRAYGEIRNALVSELGRDSGPELLEAYRRVSQDEITRR